MTALERIKESLSKHQVGRNQLVRLTAGDVVEVASQVPPDAADHIVAVLGKGASAVKPEQTIYQMVDDVTHLVSLVE